jgi:hypothetical protein
MVRVVQADWNGLLQLNEHPEVRGRSKVNAYKLQFLLNSKDVTRPYCRLCGVKCIRCAQHIMLKSHWYFKKRVMFLSFIFEFGLSDTKNHYLLIHLVIAAIHEKKDSVSYKTYSVRF